mgnify:CR=1 FL=1
MIYDMGSLPGVRGPGAGSVPARAPDPDLPEAQPALGTACRGLRRLAGHDFSRHQRLHAPDRHRPP